MTFYRSSAVKSLFKCLCIYTIFLDFPIFRLSLGDDDLVDWNSGTLSVRTSTKKFFQFRSNLVCR